MEGIPSFSSSKRHAIIFGCQSSPLNMITAQFPDPKTEHLTPSNVSISAYHTPETIEEALALSASSTTPTSRGKHSTQTRLPLGRAQSSEYYLEIKKSPSPRKDPRSRKLGFTTIRTDATETQPAFESDAFAVQMPTTREPILDPPIFRAKLPTPSQAQVEAYQTYKEKAQQVRERNNSEGVRVPSKIVSYDYACATKAGYTQTRPPQSDLNLSTPDRPPVTAGSFPISPPLEQHAWTRPRHSAHVQTVRSMSESSNISIARKPVGLGDISPQTTRPYYPRGDVETGASPSTPPPASTRIKVRIKPKASSVEMGRSRGVNWWTQHHRSPYASPPDSSRSPSPTKAMANFAFTKPPVTSETIFGNKSHDTSGTASLTPSRKEKEREMEKVKKVPPKRAFASRWAWLRPAGPRVNKSTTTPTPRAPVAARPTTYVDPFVLHATPAPTNPSTPTVSRPGSPPKKLAHPAPVRTPAQVAPNGKFDTGFAQVKSLTSLILKLCLLIYALVGLYFILDAIREAVHALGAPFRVVKFVTRFSWIGLVWIFKAMGKGWKRWGFKIALEGGWK